MKRLLSKKNIKEIVYNRLFDSLLNSNHRKFLLSNKYKLLYLSARSTQSNEITKHGLSEEQILEGFFSLVKENF